MAANFNLLSRKINTLFYRSASRLNTVSPQTSHKYTQQFHKDTENIDFAFLPIYWLYLLQINAILPP